MRNVRVFYVNICKLFLYDDLSKRVAVITAAFIQFLFVVFVVEDKSILLNYSPHNSPTFNTFDFDASRLWASHSANHAE